MKERGYKIGNIDVTLILQTPKVSIQSTQALFTSVYTYDTTSLPVIYLLQSPLETCHIYTLT